MVVRLTTGFLLGGAVEMSAAILNRDTDTKKERPDIEVSTSSLSPLLCEFWRLEALSH
jgi:hypothetical protein